MGVTKKFDEFLKSQDEKYILSLKEYFFDRFQFINSQQLVSTEGKLNSEKFTALLTIDFVTDLLAEVPGGFSKFLHLVDKSIEPISEFVLHIIAEYFVKHIDSSVFEDYRNELDSGSDKALLAMVNNTLMKLGKEDLTSSKKEFQMCKNILINLNGKLFKLLMQSTLSIHLKLFESAKMQIQHSLKVILHNFTTYNIQHAVVEKSAVKDKAKLAGKKGTDQRWKFERQIKNEAFKRLSEMKMSGKFKNNSQASKKLAECLCDYAKQLGKPFPDTFSAQRRIYDWFREEN